MVLQKLVQSFRQSEKLQQHVEFLYAKGSVYHIENGNLLYHGAVPMTRKGTFAVERFEGHAYSGRALMDYCDERARRGYFAPEGRAARRRYGTWGAALHPPIPYAAYPPEGMPWG